MPLTGTAWTDVGVFATGVFAALAASGAALVSYWVFRSQTDPQVVVYTTVDVNRPPIILLIVENIGRGVARHISFEVSAPLPARAFGKNAPAARMESGPLVSGIPSLGPGARRATTWGDYEGLLKALGDRTIEITVTYRGEAVGPFDPHWYESTYPLEVFSFEGTDASDTNWEKKSANALGKIERTLSLFSSGFHKLRVIPISPDRPENVQEREDDTE